MNIYGVIYKFENKLNGKIYIGQTTQKLEKYYRNTYVLDNAHKRIKLQNTIKKYGLDAFIFSQIDSGANQEELNQKEIHYIELFNCIINGYNCRSGGSRGKHSPETRAKMGKCRVGTKVSEASKLKMSLSHLGQQSGNKGNVYSEASRLKISESKKGCVPWNKGIPADETTKLRLQNINLGRTPPNKGIPMSESQKLLVSQNRKGKGMGNKNNKYSKKDSTQIVHHTVLL